MNLFPLFEDITGKTFLLVGGGRIATEKLEKLRMFTDDIIVVAEETVLSTEEGPAAGIREVRVRAFEDDDLDGIDYCIGATNDRALNRRVSELCRERHIPVNIVDDAELCTFIFPSIVKRGDLVAAVTTAGKSPAFGQYVRKTLEKELPEDTEQILDELFALKTKLKETEPDQKERARQLKAYLRERVAWDE